MEAPRSNAFGADAAAKRVWLSAQIGAGRIAPDRLLAARAALSLTSSPRGWLTLISATLGAAGLVLLAAALLCAVAFNWDALGHFSRFALAQGVLALFVALAWWRGTHTVAGAAALAAAVLATGALLAIFERVSALGTHQLGRAVLRARALLVIGGVTAILVLFVLWRHHGRLGDAQLASLALFASAAFGTLLEKSAWMAAAGLVCVALAWLVQSMGGRLIAVKETS